MSDLIHRISNTENVLAHAYVGCPEMRSSEVANSTEDYTRGEFGERIVKPVLNQIEAGRSLGVV